MKKLIVVTALVLVVVLWTMTAVDDLKAHLNHLDTIELAHKQAEILQELPQESVAKFALASHQAPVKIRRCFGVISMHDTLWFDEAAIQWSAAKAIRIDVYPTEKDAKAGRNRLFSVYKDLKHGNTHRPLTTKLKGDTLTAL